MNKVHLETQPRGACSRARLLTAGMTLVLCLAETGGVVAQATQDAWPTVEQQLQVAGAAKGTALESLIRSNQEFWMLRPSELNDTIVAPPWLRVWWRKAHPEQTFAGDDPTGGYPLALKEIGEWLSLHPNLRSDFDPLAATPIQPLATHGPNRSVSGPSPDSKSESDIRMFPGDPRRLIAASNNVSWTGGQAQFASADGGVTWSATLLEKQPGDDLNSDPAVGWALDGTAWSMTLGIGIRPDPDPAILRLRLYRSTDWGVTWQFDSTVSGDRTGVDKELLWVDHAATSPYRGNLYAIWHDGQPVFISRRSAAGVGTIVRVSRNETTGTGIGGDVKTNAAGAVFGFWPDTGSRKIFVARSLNGGTSYAPPIRIASTFDSFDIGVPAQSRRRALVYVSAGVFDTPTRNLVYAAWTDLSGAADCSSPAQEPNENAASTCKTRIWFARSQDGGQTWGAKSMVKNQTGKNDQFNQALTVDEATGAIGIVYYDTVGDPTRRKTNVWYQSSYDEGLTWTAPLKVTTAATNQADGGADGNQYGDYNGMTSGDHAFYPSWTDRRTNAREEIWTARVSDPPPACTPPSPPTSLKAVAGVGSVTVAWKPVVGAAEYHVYRSAKSGGPYQFAGSVAASATSFTVERARPRSAGLPRVTDLRAL